MAFSAPVPVPSGRRRSIKVISGRWTRNCSTASRAFGGLGNEQHVPLGTDDRGQPFAKDGVILHAQYADWFHGIHGLPSFPTIVENGTRPLHALNHAPWRSKGTCV